MGNRYISDQRKAITDVLLFLPTPVHLRYVKNKEKCVFWETHDSEEKNILDTKQDCHPSKCIAIGQRTSCSAVIFLSRYIYLGHLKAGRMGEVGRTEEGEN